MAPEKKNISRDPNKTFHPNNGGRFDPLNPSISPKPPTNQNLKPIHNYVLAGFVAGLFLALIYYISDRFGTFWAGILLSIPVSLIIITFRYQGKKLKNFSLAIILAGSCSLIAAIIFFLFINNTNHKKITILTIVLIIWLALVTILFSIFKDDLKDE